MGSLSRKIKEGELVSLPLKKRNGDKTHDLITSASRTKTVYTVGSFEPRKRIPGTTTKAS
jgi:hypothetical protein